MPKEQITPGEAYMHYDGRVAVVHNVIESKGKTMIVWFAHGNQHINEESEFVTFIAKQMPVIEIYEKNEANIFYITALAISEMKRFGEGDRAEILHKNMLEHMRSPDPEATYESAIKVIERFVAIDRI